MQRSHRSWQSTVTRWCFCFAWLCIACFCVFVYLFVYSLAYLSVSSISLLTWLVHTDAIQVRPTEVLFEEWAALKATGVCVPAITIWQV